MLKPTSSNFVFGDVLNRTLLLRLSDQPARPNVGCVRYPAYGEWACVVSTYLPMQAVSGWPLNGDISRKPNHTSLKGALSLRIRWLDTGIRSPGEQPDPKGIHYSHRVFVPSPPNQDERLGLPSFHYPDITHPLGLNDLLS